MTLDEMLVDGPRSSTPTIVLAHGAGAPMDSPFMETIARGLAHERIRVARFEFPYMRARRIAGKRGAPDREPVLMAAWREAIELLGGGAQVVVGGKSMGGRIASMVADEAGARGVVCLGYPFHPPGKPPGPRLKHLKVLRTRALIVQGTRDSFGGRAEVEGYDLSRRIRLEWIEDGDHSFKPRARSGRTEAENLAAAIGLVRDFMRQI